MPTCTAPFRLRSPCACPLQANYSWAFFGAVVLRLLCFPETVLTWFGIPPFTPFLRFMLVTSWLFPLASLLLATCLEGVSLSDRAGWVFHAIIIVEAVAVLSATFDVPQRRAAAERLHEHYKDALQLLEDFSDLHRFCALILHVINKLQTARKVASGAI